MGYLKGSNEWNYFYHKQFALCFVTHLGGFKVDYSIPFQKTFEYKSSNVMMRLDNALCTLIILFTNLN